jgi:hypothetical protein
MWTRSLIVAALAGLWPALANGATVNITRQDCARVVAHQPAADVAYQPGVDVNGQPVVPADLDGGPRIVSPKEIVIPIEIDLQQRLGRSDADRKYESDAKIGTVTYRDGQAFYDGQPLGGRSEADLVAACRNLLDK